MKVGGVYCIENLKNDKKYIGQSTDLKKRKYEHFRMLKGNCHFNTHLQNAYNKYGEENFVFEILIYCEPVELDKYEQYFIEKHGEYNICKIPGPTTTGYKYSKKTRKYLSKINSGKNNPMYGKFHSKKTKNLMSKKAMGKNNPMYGRSWSDKSKEKLILSISGENNSSAKLIWKDVRWIRKYKEKYSVKYIMKKFNVCSSTIYNILSNKTWKEGADHSCDASERII